jgi:predicted outer membrane repeat protein
MKTIFMATFMVIALWFGVNVFADTTWVTPLTINGAAHWTREGNPYIIQGGVEIFAGGVLTIDAGVHAYFDTGSYWPNASFKVYDGGQLLANGTYDDSIIFATRYSDLRKGNFRIEGGASFSYCTFYRLYSQSTFNTAYGGAMHLISAEVNLSHCIFRDNRGNESAGAMAIDYSTVNLDQCKFTENSTSMVGGAIEIFGNSTVNLERCSFDSNYANVGEYCGGSGGGIGVNVGGANILVNHCNFFGNHSSEGGAISSEGNLEIEGCLFYNNYACRNGGAIRNYAFVIFHNNTVVFNRSDSICGGVFATNFIGYNNIIRNNSSPDSSQVLELDSITYSNIEGGYPGTGNIDIDPQFVNAGAGNFHLTCSSPCIDAGDPASPLDPDYTRADMGAYYYHHMNGSGDANYDCQVMGADVTYLVRYFKGIGAAPYPLWRGDASGDTTVAGADVVYLVRYLKGLGNPPVKNPNCSHPDWSIPDSCDPCGY